MIKIIYYFRKIYIQNNKMYTKNFENDIYFLDISIMYKFNLSVRIM